MENIQIKTDDIQLDQLLKLASIVESGGQVKYMIADELIKLNGNIVTERRRRIRPGDIVEVDGVGKLSVIKIKGE
ncbi:RNA-binding S4 domain-containing protein [Anaerosinus sp.]|uniref:RNA-binding S4 domain-containing protein n=1 Tax=Selenobaculum sp. TaxID=3074374 RepID=UPI003AB36C59